MPRPSLRLVTSPPKPNNQAQLYVGVTDEKLWELVNDSSIHLLLREPALRELADRRALGIMIHCDEMLESNEVDEWFAAVRTLGQLRTEDSVERLIRLYAQTNLRNRRVVTCALARNLTADHIHPFSIMVRELAEPGVLDVTGWTLVAIGTLKHVCKRFDILVDDSSLEIAVQNEFLGLVESGIVER
ncbi:MAG: hypothetical protein JSW61_01205 [Candidatus Thorarchaeota archaeon]|nr:MAG: hypothetical protein JSW61_01205 [Candidatus Thorarchaeota archaeon]